MSFETQEDVNRKILSILKILSDSQEPLGSSVIARLLKEYGINLAERTVRYHLKLMDERGLTQLVGWRDGRTITEQGMQEVKNAMVKDKVGLAISRIEMLAFRTDFNLEKSRGIIPVNISFFAKEIFYKALQMMKPAIESGLCVSDLVGVASEGERLGELIVPQGKVGLATVCSVVINGCLLRAGIPMDSRFSGLLQVRNHKPLRFAELIHYSGSSLDPAEIFIKGKMTSINEVTKTGYGEILANFREIPALCLPVAQRVVSELKSAGLGGVLVIGNTSEAVCEISVDFNKIGMILIGGLNPVAAAIEADIEAEVHAISTVMEYRDLVKYQEVLS